ncbi:ribonuclease H-like domain-containing protein [Tanacetum coccineum]|uniref:Ribonuclease H-like domain-containing protein n=1 Tax=Tanacetum coccineum TaxID=301880 RepID=A0ABQ5I6H0_9ASTR
MKDDTTGNDRQESRYSKETVKVEETSSKAMVAIDGAGFDWSYMADDEVPTNMALMAFSDSEDRCGEPLKFLILSNSGLKEILDGLSLKAMDLDVSLRKEDSSYVDSVKTWLIKMHKIGQFSISQTSRNLIEDMLPLGGAKGGKITGKGTLKTVKLVLQRPTLDESMHDIMLSHINFKTINKLVKENLVRRLPTKRFENDQTCVACLKGKQHKASCKSKIQNSITQPLFMLHMDLFGPTFVSSLMNKKYCLVVTDDYSRFTWVFFIETKDETSGILKSFITEIENLVDKKVKIIRCDNGIEFKNRVMSDFYEQNGIKSEYGVARTPQQNVVAKRRNWILIEAARTMLANSKLPTIFWAEAVNTVCYVQNMVLVVKLTNKTLSDPVLEQNTYSKLHETIWVLGWRGDKPIIASDGPKWLFDIDVLTKSMNYIPVVTDYILMPLWKDGSLFDSSSKNVSNDEPQPSSDDGNKDDEGVCKESRITGQEKPENSTQGVNTTGLIEHKKVIQALRDPSWIEAMQDELLQFKLQKGYTQEERIDYDEVFALVVRIEANIAYVLFMNFVVYQMDVKSAFLYGMIKEEDYVYQPLGFEDPEFPDRVYKVEKALYGLHQAPRAWSTRKEMCTEFEKLMHKKFQMSFMGPDIMFVVCACTRFQVTPKVSHLHAMKRIFRYLKGQPKLGLWYPKDSPFDLEAYTDSDYAGASLDRKSSTGGCQFLKSRLILWQCKKQTVVANSTSEEEYVAASNCRRQVLWIQNQMLDYGYNFMNTKIFIDNESTICIVKNPVFHSKTKHIKIRHHFIRDSYEKILIQVIKIHTDHNVADLLTKALDVSHFQFLTASIGMLNL